MSRDALFAQISSSARLLLETRERLERTRQARARLEEEEAALAAAVLKLEERVASDAPSDVADESVLAAACPGPSDMAAGSMDELLGELGLAPLYSQTFAEYELTTVAQLTRLGTAEQQYE